MPSTYLSLHYHLVFSTKIALPSLNHRGGTASMSIWAAPSRDSRDPRRELAASLTTFISWLGSD